jgi:uncharacterized OsmC-like protein
MSDDVPKGYQQIRVAITVKSDATADALRECMNFSPVYEMISRSLPVEVEITVE